MSQIDVFHYGQLPAYLNCRIPGWICRIIFKKNTKNMHLLLNLLGPLTEPQAWPSHWSGKKISTSTRTAHI